MTDTKRILYTGKYLGLAERDGWEFATRNHPTVAVLVAWTDAGELLLVEQHRLPVGGPVIELPAGLTGDQAGQDDEDVLTAAARELEEETGYQARKLTELLRCPTSAGMTDEIAVFIRAEGLERVGEGGGDDSEDITVHRVPGDEAADWLAKRAADGAWVDPKIFAALYWRQAETGQVASHQPTA